MVLSGMRPEISDHLAKRADADHQHHHHQRENSDEHRQDCEHSLVLLTSNLCPLTSDFHTFMMKGS